MEIGRLASRLSLDILGRRPTESELLAVRLDPASLEAQVQTWLADPAFEERVVSLFADVYRTRPDRYVVEADGDAAFHDLTYRAQFMRSVGEEPLRLVGRVAALDLPWTDVVTADWTLANDLLLAHFPIEALESGGEGWRPARYLDGRPAAGVLGTNGMWWRYTSTTDNLNRGRAAAIARILLCDQRYDGTVDFQKSEEADVSARISTDPACVACHVSLDPIASTLWGFWRHHPESYTEALRYYPSRELDWASRPVAPPGFYGQDVDSLYELGQAIADDPRFGNCAVAQTWSFLLGREPTVAETDRFNDDRDAFVRGGLVYRNLFRAVADDPWYRSDSADFEGTTAPRRLTPDQLAASVEALTGYRWTVADGIDAMVNDTWGFRILNGGVDGSLVVTSPATESAPVALVQERLAELAAPYAVADELLLPAGDRVLFREVQSLEAEPTDEELRAQIAGLLLRVHGAAAAVDSEQVTILVELWTTLRAESSGPAEAWAWLLSALFRHPDFVLY